MEIPKDLENILLAEKPKQKINLPQDFIDGKMYYGFSASDTDYVINSQKEMKKVEGLKENGLLPATEKLIDPLFPTIEIPSYSNGRMNVQLSNTYSKIIKYLKRYLHLRNDYELDLLTTWAIGTYMFRVFRYYPYLHLSGEKGSGKSTTMAILKPIVFNGEMMVNSSAAVIYRSITLRTPTLFLDEFEKQSSRISESYKALTDVLKTGFEKSGIVKRCAGDQYIPQKYDTYCPKVIAGINEIDDVLADRTIKIRMDRKTKDSTLKRYIITSEEEIEQKKIRDELYFIGLEYAHKIHKTYEAINMNENTNLVHLNNRRFDVWSPLMAIAQVIDQDDMSLQIVSKLIELSRLNVDDMRNEDSLKNESVILATFIHELINGVYDSITPVKSPSDSNLLRFDTDDVLKEINDQKILEQKVSKPMLSRLLHEKINVRVKECYHPFHKKTKRMYEINVAEFSESYATLTQ